MRNKLTDELAVCGMNAVCALAEYHPEQINRLFLREDRFRSFTRLCKSLAERKRPYKICEDEELEKICKSSHHQGVVAMIFEPGLEALSREDLEVWAREGKTGLVLHGVENDHNLGAIIRSAAFFDAPWIVIADLRMEAAERSPEETSHLYLSTSAYRVAEGGMEHVKIRRVRNTAAFLRDASRQLISIGTAPRARQRLEDLPAIIREKSAAFKSPSPGIALVLGSEEAGLPEAVSAACSCLVRIPGTGLMDSLNVSQAAALFLQRIFEL